ncbi:MAG: nucleotidyltransferase domain-containing protein [Bdellovibrionaceae bacterium]|nr:nucleotidyltransferase domain-containing protein [Pseudobdellovibrionaceae bacterium]
MSLQRKSPFEVSKNILRERYPKAEVAFVAGSFNRNEETKYSDIDLVVVFSKLEAAWRESFVYDGWPVEAFVHDPETLNYFFNEVDGKDGTPSLPMMVIEGPSIPEDNSLSKKLKKLAQAVIDKGPPKWSKDTIYHNRYMITDLIDDIREPRNQNEANAVLGSLHETLGNFYFRANGMWSASRKHIPRKLKKINSDLHIKWVTAFNDAFCGKTEEVIQLATEITEPFGGLLFDGYRRDAPKDWRVKDSGK